MRTDRQSSSWRWSLPILLLVLFGIFDFGSAISDWNSETSLANVGVRIAAVGTLSPRTLRAAPARRSSPICSARRTRSTRCRRPAAATGLQGPVAVTVCTPSGGNRDRRQPDRGQGLARHTNGFRSASCSGAASRPPRSPARATMRLENTYPTSVVGDHLLELHQAPADHARTSAQTSLPRMQSRLIEPYFVAYPESAGTGSPTKCRARDAGNPASRS